MKRYLYLFILVLTLSAFSEVRAQDATPTPSPTPTPTVETKVDDTQNVKPENLNGVPTIAPNYKQDDQSLPDLGRVGVDMMEQKPLGLKEAITLALENNKDIEVTRQNVKACRV
jgi:hypothetical protein